MPAFNLDNLTALQKREYNDLTKSEQRAFREEYNSSGKTTRALREMRPSAFSTTRGSGVQGGQG
jgi:hypothetical protein